MNNRLLRHLSSEDAALPGSPTLRFRSAQFGFPASPSSPSSHHGRTYIALRPVRLRAGIGRDTAATELLRKGEEVRVLEIRLLLDASLPHDVLPDFRTLRCRTVLGWASLSAADGTELLRPLADLGSLGTGIPELHSASDVIDVAKMPAARPLTLSGLGKATSAEWALFKVDMSKKHAG